MIQPYYSEPSGIIYNADCLDVMREMADKSVDLVLTDPPYFETRGDFDFIWKDKAEYLIWCKEWIKLCSQKLRDGGSIYIYGWYEILKDYHVILEENGMVFKSFITWNFSNGNRTNNNWSKVCEYILYFTKGDESYFNAEDIRTKNWKHGKWEKGYNPNGMCPTNYFDDDKVVHNSFERTDHPTQKPVKQIQKIIKASSKEGDTVFDPFLGSGTTARACKDLGRKFIGIEISKEYCDIAVKRLEQEVMF
jgi:site-specific DNA-methyltransferase (adenine-specific)